MSTLAQSAKSSMLRADGCANSKIQIAIDTFPEYNVRNVVL